MLASYDALYYYVAVVFLWLCLPHVGQEFTFLFRGSEQSHIVMVHPFIHRDLPLCLDPVN